MMSRVVDVRGVVGGVVAFVASVLEQFHVPVVLFPVVTVMVYSTTT